MKATLILAAVGVVAAQNLAGVPNCATGCLSAAISSASCAPTDAGCQCGTKQAQIGQFAAPCLISSCNAADLIAAQTAGASLCAAYSAQAGVTTTGGAQSTTKATTAASSSTATGSVTKTGSSTSAPMSTTAPVSGGATTTKSTTASTSSVKSVNAAAQPVALGVGALAAFIGAIAAL